MPRPGGWLRAGLLLYLVVTALVGIWASLWPRGFYHDFPWPGHAWVAPLPAYNEHLVRDFGGMNLAMAVVFGSPPPPLTGGWPPPPWSPTWSSPSRTWPSTSST
jgi:hypothetical protein